MAFTKEMENILRNYRRNFKDRKKADKLAFKEAISKDIQITRPRKKRSRNYKIQKNKKKFFDDYGGVI